KANSHSIMRRQKYLLIAVGDLGGDQLVVILYSHRDDSVVADVGKLRKLGLLDDAAPGRHHDELALLELAHRDDAGEFLFLGYVDQVDDRLTSPGRRGVRNLVDFQFVDLATVRKNHHVAMGRRHKDMLDDILGLERCAFPSRAAAPLGPINRGRGPLYIARVSNSDRHVLVGDQVFQRKLGARLDDLGPASVTILFLDLAQFLYYQVAQRGFI